MGRNRALKIPLATAALALVLLSAGPAGTQVPGPPTQVAAQAPNFDLNWYSVNDGGKIATTSASFELGLSIGQAAAGERTSANFELGIGFWYGSAPPEETCDCGVWGDVSGDGLINPIDVVMMVNFVYKGNDTRVQPPNCSRQAGDVNCDNAVNPVDVVRYVNYVYKGQTNAFCADPCGP